MQEPAAEQNVLQDFKISLGFQDLTEISKSQAHVIFNFCGFMEKIGEVYGLRFQDFKISHMTGSHDL